MGKRAERRQRAETLVVDTVATFLENIIEEGLTIFKLDDEVSVDRLLALPKAKAARALLLKKNPQKRDLVRRAIQWMTKELELVLPETDHWVQVMVRAASCGDDEAVMLAHLFMEEVLAEASTTTDDMEDSFSASELLALPESKARREQAMQGPNADLVERAVLILKLKLDHAVATLGEPANA